MISRRKSCPNCAERVRQPAKVCRFCGFEFPIASQVILVEGVRPRWLWGGVTALVLLIAGAISFIMIQDIGGRNDASDAIATPAASANFRPASQQEYEQLLIGDKLEWSAQTSPDLVEKRLGPYVISITKSDEDDLVAPVVEIRSAGQSVKMHGAHTSPSYSHRITAIQNIKGRHPIVMLESFTGGAHCCNNVQIAGLSGGRIKVLTLGSWDGDQIESPSDLSGDGVTDFVERNNSFLYAFASYASSYAPPQILNVLGGKIIDVSKRPAYRKLHAKLVNEAGEVCRSGESGDQRNGACPAYVASAALSGGLDKAWTDMLASYDASTDWEFPTGCRVVKDPCPSGLEIQFKSYPESLLYFLKEQGYVARSWMPPEAREAAPSAKPTDSLPDDWAA